MKQMKQKRKSLRKDTRGFTGLEAAIVLTAFIVVAAVFSYMVLGAGFFSTEKAKAVVHTGVEQATSSCELSGDVIGHGDSAGDKVMNVTFYLQLTAGNNPLDMNKMTIAYTDEYVYGGLTAQGDGITLGGAGQWNYSWPKDRTGGELTDLDSMLEKSEKVKVYMRLPSDAGNNAGVAAYDWFQIEVKPEQGGTLPIKKTVPGSIDDHMVLH
jgi:flagellin FlaB